MFDNQVNGNQWGHDSKYYTNTSQEQDCQYYIMDDLGRRYEDRWACQVYILSIDELNYTHISAMRAKYGWSYC